MDNQISEIDFPIRFFNKTPVIELPKRLSILEAGYFAKTCRQLLMANSRIEQVVLDLSETKFIDSSGVGALVNILKATREKDVELILMNVHAASNGSLVYDRTR